jgi:hypothetical protein
VTIGSPVVTYETFWSKYCQLLQCFLQDLETHDEDIKYLISSQHTQAQEIEQDSIPLIESMKELRQGDQVIGPSSSMDDGDGSDYASFTDISNDKSSNESYTN